MKTLRSLAALAIFISTAASAEPTKLKLAFFASDQTSFFVNVLKPFIEAVNAEGKGLIEIEAFTGGSLGRNPSEQLKLLVDGAADIVYLIPGLTPQRLTGTEIIELPGLFRDCREATLAFTRLANAGALPGYEDFVVVGAVATGPQEIHVKPPATDLAALKGRRIQTTNIGVATAIERLGMIPVSLPVSMAAEAIASGKIDGSVLAVGALADFGIARITATHYLLPTAPTSLAVLMSRAKFDSLPEVAQTLLRKYSGEWFAQQHIAFDAQRSAEAMEQIKANPARRILQPSKPELDLAKGVFDAIVSEWAERSPGNMALLKRAEAELVRIRLNP